MTSRRARSRRLAPRPVSPPVAGPAPAPVPRRIAVLGDPRAGAPDPGRALARLGPGDAAVFRPYAAGLDGAGLDRLAAACRDRGISLFVAASGRAGDRGCRLGTAGLHLPAWRLRRAAPAAGRVRRRRAGPVSASVHGLVEIRRAERAGATLLLLGPVFPTGSHPGARPLGILRFARLARATALPVYGLGGVRDGHRRRIAAAGGAGIAFLGLDPRASAALGLNPTMV